MKWKIQFFSIIYLTLILFILNFNIVNSASTLYSGSFNLYLNENGSMGSQLSNYYVAIQYLNSTPINTTANINGRESNDVYTSILKFTTNTNGEMRILTNLNESQNHRIEVSVNEVETLMANQSIFTFSNGDNIIILFEVSSSTITATHINAIMGIIGIALFCANPLMSYIFTKKAKDKFEFLFMLIAIGIISIGLIFSFIYGG